MRAARWGRSTRSASLMRGDGTLVHVQRGKAIWYSGTHDNPGACAVFQGDGNVVIYRNGRALCSDGTQELPPIA